MDAKDLVRTSRRTAWWPSLLTVVLLAACGVGSTANPSTLDAPATGLPPAAATATPALSSAPTASQQSSADPAAVRMPPKPAGVTFSDQVKDLGSERYEITYTVTWRSPRSDGVEIRVYGVTACLSEPTAPPELASPDRASGPCLVEHTRLPSSVLELLVTAAASDGTASWTWIDEHGGCEVVPMVAGPDGSGPSYRAVVLAAYSPAGHSIFAIAEPGAWWWPGPGDMPC